MKNLPLLFFFSLLIVSCKGSGEGPSDNNETSIDSNYCDCNDLIFDQPYNHFYRFERTEPFTGKCELFYPDSTLKMEKNFIDGKVHGPLITYHENGQVHEEKEFKMNVQTGEFIIYTKSGKVKYHGLYKNGKQTELIESNPQLSLDD